MQIEKNKIMKVGASEYLVVDYLFYRGQHYILAVDVLPDNEVGEELRVFQEVRKDHELFIQKVTDEAILKYVCPIFEHNLKVNLI